MKALALLLILTLVGSSYAQCDPALGFGPFCLDCDSINGCTYCPLISDDLTTCFNPEIQCRPGEYAILDPVLGYGTCAVCNNDIPKCAQCNSVFDTNLLQIVLEQCSVQCQANEYVDVNAGSCLSCSQYCSSCSAANTCDIGACDADYSVQNAGTTDCDPLPACLDNQYGVPANCQNCDATNPGCTVSCTDGNTCTECGAGLYVLNGACVACDQPTQYIDGLNCIECSTISDCINCSGANQCTACSNGYYVRNGQCTNQCGDPDFTTFIFQGTDCLDCSANIPNCIECFGENDCSFCDVANNYLVKDGLCSTDCSESDRINLFGIFCLTCADFSGFPTCIECDELNGCTNCGVEFVKAGSCVADCNQDTTGFYPLNGRCFECSTTLTNDCLACTDGNTCTDCNGKLIQDGQCTDSCDDGYYQVGLNCLKCSDSLTNQCIKCSDATTCTDCNGQFIFNGQCRATCDQRGNYAEGLNCLECSGALGPLCESCSSGAACDDCGVGNFIKDGQCSPDCADTDRFVLGTIYCNLCSDYINLCVACNSQTECTDCNGNYIKDGLCSVDCADQDRYVDGLNCLKCGDAITDCLACTDANTCTDCGTKYFYQGNQCDDCDQRGQYIDGANCFNCADSLGPFCESCSSGAACDDCGVGNFIKDGQCSPDCTDTDRFVIGTVYCNLCSDYINLCVACNSETECTDCNGNYFKDGLCSVDCDDTDRYVDGLNCLKCGDAIADCKACSDANTCTDCGAKFIFYGNQCVDNCDAAELYAVGNQCLRCSDTLNHCISCDQADVCLDCDGWFFKDNQCSETCDDSDRFTEGLNCLLCGDFIADCQACSDRNTCTDCGEKYIKEGQCVDSCGSGYFQNEATHTCEPCDLATYHCTECSTGPTICDACDEANGWYNDVVEAVKQKYCVNYNPNCNQPGNTCDFYKSTKLYKPRDKACYHGHCFVAQWTPRHIYPDGSGEADIPDLFAAPFAWKVVNYDVNCCTAEPFNPNRIYDAGKIVKFNGVCYRAKYYTSTKGWTTEFQFYAWNVVPANDPARNC